MGRRGNFRGRPGFLTIICCTACLTIFYLSWKFLNSQNTKEIDTVQIQHLIDYNNVLNQISQSNKNVATKRHGQEEDNRLGYMALTKTHAAPVVQQYEATEDKELAKKSAVRKTSTERPTRSETQTQAPVETYQQPDEVFAKKLTFMEKFVHLDLKGAPPKMSYLHLFIQLIKQLGATGLLIEYEDMFPYAGVLEPIRANNAYSKENLKELLEYASRTDLAVMPLIPTFGHMEFVLKSELSHLRESDYTPQVIDITQNASYAVISEMIKQVLSVHPDATHLHIGCGEVYELGKEASATEMQLKNLSASQMFLQHVVRVATIVREFSSSVTPVIWDDELRQISSQDLEDSVLYPLVEIMVLDHSTDVPRAINKHVWNKYATIFKSVWIASSFKGSTGAGQIFTEPEHHLRNHLSWLNVIRASGPQLTFRGIVLTGRQRYDHFSTLCELLPVAIPNLAICLATVLSGEFTEDILGLASKRMGCKHPIEFTFTMQRRNVASGCTFPGYEVYYPVKELYTLNVGGSGTTNLVDGWLSDYQLAHSFTNPGWLKVLNISLTEERASYSRLSVILKGYLSMIYTEDTVDEWIEENIQVKLKYINILLEKIKSLQQISYWPRRPLPSLVAMKQIADDDNVNRDNNNREHQLKFDTNKQPASEASQNEPVIWKWESSEKYPGTAAPQSQNQLKNYTASDQKETLVSYKTPHANNDFENAHNQTLTNSKFPDVIGLPHLRSMDSNNQNETLLDKGVTDGNTLLHTLSERQGDSGIDKNITSVQNNVTAEGNTDSKSQIYTAANDKSLPNEELLNVDRSKDSQQADKGATIRREYSERVTNNEIQMEDTRSGEVHTHNSTEPTQTL